VRYVIDTDRDTELQSILDAAKQAGIIKNWTVNAMGDASVEKAEASPEVRKVGEDETRCTDCDKVFPIAALWHTTPPLGSREPHVYQCNNCREYMIKAALKGHAALIEEKNSTDPRRSAA
jgi:hypothetical protein